MKTTSSDISSIEIKVVSVTNGLPPCRVYKLFGKDAAEFVRSISPDCKLSYRWNDMIYIPEDKNETQIS
jgi:hypothetical protein